MWRLTDEELKPLDIYENGNMQFLNSKRKERYTFILNLQGRINKWASHRLIN